jgi:GGDEF domain-containing protein
LISIRKSVDDLNRLDELDRRESLSSAVLECYALAIHSSAHYAVEVDPSLAVEYRGHLAVLEKQSRAAVTADQLRAVQSSFRGELREYRDKSDEQLKKMRKEIEDATAAMLVFAETVTSNGADHEEEVRAQLRNLETTARSNDVNEIRSGIGTVVAGIESSVVQIQRSNQLVIAQLQDEIRALHQQIELERKALYTDRASGAWNRQKIDVHLDNMLRQKQPFCLLLLSIRNYKRIESQYSRTVVEGTLRAMISRFAAIIGDEPVIGRWTEDQFVAVLDLPVGDVVQLSSVSTRKLSGGYAVQENGLSQTVTIQATTGVIERSAGADSPAFHQKLQQLAGAISGA